MAKQINATKNAVYQQLGKIKNNYPDSFQIHKDGKFTKYSIGLEKIVVPKVDYNFTPLPDLMRGWGIHPITGLPNDQLGVIPNHLKLKYWDNFSVNQKLKVNK